MAGSGMTDKVKEQVLAVVEKFNENVVRDPNRFFVPRFKGAFVYLDRQEGRQVTPRGRLKYTGDFKAWDFAIYRYSSGRYDPDEWMFPGGEYLDGSVEGALKACADAYP